MSDSTTPGGIGQPPREDEQHPTWPTGAPRTAAATALGALAGAVAGTAAGLGTMIVGPVGAIFGAIVGAEVIASTAEMSSQAAATEPAYSTEHDEHYRALWESDAGRPADVAFETMRPAYRFGHAAAYHPAFVGRDFHGAEEDLRAAWERDLGAQNGAWDRVRQHVCDAYGHSRGENFGIRRDLSIIGPAGSAVDPVELDRARSGLSSVDGATTAGIAYDHPGYAEVNNDNALGIAPAGVVSESGRSGGLGEWPETDASTAHRADSGYH
jgi:hypothetical protein